jgi:hypothetical protein
MYGEHKDFGKSNFFVFCRYKRIIRYAGIQRQLGSKVFSGWKTWKIYWMFVGYVFFSEFYVRHIRYHLLGRRKFGPLVFLE